jgi:hypothetical protein
MCSDRIIPPFQFDNFCRSYGTFNIVNIVNLCEHNSSEVFGPVAFIFGRMIGHDV